MAVNGIPHDVKVYPGVGHGFLNDPHDRMYQMMKVAGIGYDEPAAQDARRRIVAFFDAQLRS